MYAGAIVEEGSTKNILTHPLHQYTKGLVSSIPSKDKKGKRLFNIPGRVPSIKNIKREDELEHLVRCNLF